jgi:acyl-CoA hydrolase
MEIGVRVDSEDILKCEVHHIASAYLTFVALNDAGRPTKVPPLITETDDELRRVREARTRKMTGRLLKKKNIDVIE